MNRAIHQVMPPRTAERHYADDEAEHAVATDRSSGREPSHLATSAAEPADYRAIEVCTDACCRSTTAWRLGVQLFASEANCPGSASVAQSWSVDTVRSCASEASPCSRSAMTRRTRSRYRACNSSSV